MVLNHQGTVEQMLLSAQISSFSANEIELRGSGDKGEGEVAFVVQWPRSDGIELSVPSTGSVFPRMTVVLHSESPTCYSSAPNAIPSAAVCFNGTDLVVDASQGPAGAAVHISVSRVNGANRPALEVPRTYSLPALMAQAMEHNFNSAVEFQSVVEAKLKTEAAYLNLLPHIDSNDVLNIASLNILNELKTVGDLAPFLFPTRWLQKSEAKDRTEADFDAWILTKADAANVTEGLGYNIIRDEAVVAAILENRKGIASIRDEIVERERLGLMQAGSSDDVGSVVNSIDQGYSDLLSSITEEKSSIAQAAGFFNPAAVVDVGEGGGRRLFRDAEAL
jgi:hypothetical protein